MCSTMHKVILTHSYWCMSPFSIDIITHLELLHASSLGSPPCLVYTHDFIYAKLCLISEGVSLDGFDHVQTLMTRSMSTLSLVSRASPFTKRKGLEWSHSQTPPLRREKGLAHFEPFLGFADSTVQDPELPIRFEVCDFSGDIG